MKTLLKAAATNLNAASKLHKDLLEVTDILTYVLECNESGDVASVDKELRIVLRMLEGRA